MQVIFNSFGIIDSILFSFFFFFENRMPLKPALRGVCRRANYSVVYEET